MTEPSANLRRVWDAIPDTGCKGYCVQSCGPIGASPEEARLLAERGVRVESNPTRLLLSVLAEVKDCPALVAGRCTVYDVRPTVCRLWGSVEEMPCPWGCVPDGGRLPAGRGFELLRDAGAPGG